jgi:hypothetical protein
MLLAVHTEDDGAHAEAVIRATVRLQLPLFFSPCVPTSTPQLLVPADPCLCAPSLWRGGED